MEQHDLLFIVALHTMYVSLLGARKIHDQNTPKFFPKIRMDSAKAYPCQQLMGPLPHPSATSIVSVHNPTKCNWPWEVDFITRAALVACTALSRRARNYHIYQVGTRCRGVRRAHTTGRSTSEI